MSILFLAFATAAGAVAGRAVYGTWYNHVSHYSAIWGVSLGLFELRLIDYYPLEGPTWILIGLAWLAFVAGSLVVQLGGYGAPASPGPDRPSDEVVLRRLRAAIVVLSALAAVAVVQHWMILVAKFGSVLNVIVFGNIVYSLSRTEGMEVGIPYLDSLALSGSLLGGIYMSLRRRFSLLALAPVLVVVAEGIGGMGRMKILIAVILFITGYLLTGWRRRTVLPAAARSRFRTWAIVGLTLVLFAAAGELVRAKRGIEESIPGTGGSLRALRASSFITPSIYMYLTVHHGVFNQYLRRDEEHPLAGANMFAPVYRALSKLGMDTKVSQYPKFYATPVNANSGSWLREIHADFGAVGIILVPFLTGLLCSVLWARYRDGGGLLVFAALTHLIVVVDLSSMILGTRLGYWLVSLIVSAAALWYVEHSRRTS